MEMSSGGHQAAQAAQAAQAEPSGPKNGTEQGVDNGPKSPKTTGNTSNLLDVEVPPEPIRTPEFTAVSEFPAPRRQSSNYTDDLNTLIATASIRALSISGPADTPEVTAKLQKAERPGRRRSGQMSQQEQQCLLQRRSTGIDDVECGSIWGTLTGESDSHRDVRLGSSFSSPALSRNASYTSLPITVEKNASNAFPSKGTYQMRDSSGSGKAKEPIVDPKDPKGAGNKPMEERRTRGQGRRHGRQETSPYGADRKFNTSGFSSTEVLTACRPPNRKRSSFDYNDYKSDVYHHLHLLDSDSNNNSGNND